MTTPLKFFLHASSIALLLLLVPGIGRSQEQSAPTVTQPEKSAEEPAAQPGEPSAISDAAAQDSPATATTPTSISLPAAQESPATAPTPTVLIPITRESAESETPPPAEEPAPASESAPYVVKKGDTLWDIAHALLKDPFLWPFIWKANPAIANPDLIYPGNKLNIPSLAPIERALQAPAEEPRETAVREEGMGETAEGRFMKPAAAQPEEAEEAAATGPRIIVPAEAPVPLLDKYAMLSMGFVNSEDSEDRIVRAQEKDKTIFGFNDIVYVKVRDQERVIIGDKFLIFTPLNKVKHPKTGEQYGRLIRNLGILQIIAKDSPEVLTARITLSFDAVGKNSMVTPYQEPTLIYPKAAKNVKDISGYILEVTDKRTINAQTDIVYLDRGSDAGVEPGDTFSVYDERDGRGFPRKKIGEVQVILVKERTSTAIVRRSVDAMTKGDAVAFKE